MNHKKPFLLSVALFLWFAVSLANGLKAAEISPVAAAKPAIGAGGAPKVARGTPIKDLRLATGFYTVPAAPFICAPDETVVCIILGSSTGEEAQAQLDAARAKNPAAVLLVTIAGKITIATVPLSFGTRTCVFFQPGARISAADPCSAPALVRIQDAELLSLASAAPASGNTRGILDGAGSGIIGIQVVNSGKVHVDGLAIRNCGGGGLAVTGRGAGRYADPVSLTRSTISGGAGNGLTVRDSAQFIALDNRISGNGGDGMVVDSASAILANNICAGNRTGIIVLGKDMTISRNQIIANATGLRLDKNSDCTLVSENAIQDNRTGVEILGTKATVESNSFANDKQVVIGGKDNLLQSNPGLTAAAVTTPGTDYFRPPTIADTHKDDVVWKGSGQAPMGRFDLTIASGKDPMAGTEVTQRLQAARTANPGKVLVARLVGQFKVTTKDGIALPDHTCVLLDGSITNNQTDRCDQMVKMAGKGCVSFSGGRVVSRSLATSGLSGAKGNNTLLISGVLIDLGAVNGHLGTKSVNAINSKQHGGSFVVRGCEIRDSGSRGVWIHVTSRVHVLGNRFKAGGMTIDFDAFGNHCSALYNTVTGNNYHSAIFLEEGVKHNTVFANHCLDNESTAISVHCQAVTGVTEKNTIACNLLEDNGQGKDKSGGADLSFSGLAPEKRSADNYAFNNRIVRNHGRGAINIKANTSNNYIAQSAIVDCPTTVANWTTKSAGGSFAGCIGFTTPQPRCP
jgi:hypothetical protein